MLNIPLPVRYTEGNCYAYHVSRAVWLCERCSMRIAFGKTYCPFLFLARSLFVLRASGLSTAILSVPGHARLTRRAEDDREIKLGC